MDWVQEARGRFSGLVVNAGAYSHTSIALLDALRAFDGPIVEVHLSNIFRREPYRHHSYVSLAATGVICGLGSDGYRLALEGLAARLGNAGRQSRHGPFESTDAWPSSRSTPTTSPSWPICCSGPASPRSR